MDKISDETKHVCSLNNPSNKPEGTIEILMEGQECPFCHFAKLKREGDEIVCPICGYGHRPVT
jgi:uncharacterized Zn finger protein (UPF0148 family)